MRWPIRYQILLPFAGVMLAAVLSVSLLNAYWAAARTQREIEEQLRSVARTLLTSNFPLTPNVLDQMHGLTRADFVLTSAAGNVPATSGLAAAELPAAASVTDRWEDLRLGPVVTVGDSRFFHVALGRSPGRLQRARSIARSLSRASFARCTPAGRRAAVGCGRSGARVMRRTGELDRPTHQQAARRGAHAS